MDLVGLRNTTAPASQTNLGAVSGVGVTACHLLSFSSISLDTIVKDHTFGVPLYALQNTDTAGLLYAVINDGGDITPTTAIPSAAAVHAKKGAIVAKCRLSLNAWGTSTFAAQKAVIELLPIVWPAAGGKGVVQSKKRSFTVDLGAALAKPGDGLTLKTTLIIPKGDYGGYAVRVVNDANVELGFSINAIELVVSRSSEDSNRPKFTSPIFYLDADPFISGKTPGDTTAEIIPLVERSWLLKEGIPLLNDMKQLQSSDSTALGYNVISFEGADYTVSSDTWVFQANRLSNVFTVDANVTLSVVTPHAENFSGKIFLVRWPANGGKGKGYNIERTFDVQYIEMQADPIATTLLLEEASVILDNGDLFGVGVIVVQGATTAVVEATTAEFAINLLM